MQTEKMTISEALSEINLIKKRVEKKQETIRTYLTRYSHVDDPFKTSGGSAEMIKSEQQSITDNYSRLVRIRTAISKANLATDVTVEGETKSIYSWLVWRREVQEDLSRHLATCLNQANQTVQTYAQKPAIVKNDNTGEMSLVKLEVNLDVKTWTKDAEKMTTVVEKLDGQLSLIE